MTRADTDPDRDRRVTESEEAEGSAIEDMLMWRADGLTVDVRES